MQTDKRTLMILVAASVLALSTNVSAGTITARNLDQVAREAGEGPRGGDHERAGDRQRRGGRSVEEGNDQLAREASEGPRGGDHERAGDRQRRGRSA